MHIFGNTRQVSTTAALISEYSDAYMQARVHNAGKNKKQKKWESIRKKTPV